MSYHYCIEAAHHSIAQRIRFLLEDGDATPGYIRADRHCKIKAFITFHCQWITVYIISFVQPNDRVARRGIFWHVSSDLELSFTFH